VKLFFIGAGPGDPELLTLKGKRLLEQADIVIYAGSLIPRDVLKYAKPGVPTYNSATMTLEDMTAVYQTNLDKPGIMARLHSGDPCLYGSLQEQADWCDKNGMGYEVVPGVSSFSASAATLKQEFTMPGVTQTVILTRHANRTPVPERERLSALSKINASMVIFLSVQDIEDVARELLVGYGPETPVTVVQRASWKDEKIVQGSLGDIAGKVMAEKIDRTALIIVGDALRKQFERSRLYSPDFSHTFRKAKVQ